MWRKNFGGSLFQKFPESGFATVMVIAMATVLFLIAGAMLMVGRGSSEYDIDDLLFYSAMDVVKGSVLSIAQNNTAWSNTVAYNKVAGRMACYDNAPVNCPTATEDIVLVRADNTVYYNSATDGFKLDGTVCAYNPVAIANGCVMNVTVGWMGLCGPSPCPVPGSAPPYTSSIFILRFSTPSTNGFKINSSKAWAYIPDANPYR